MWNTLVDKMLEGFLLMLEHFGLARRLQSEGFDPNLGAPPGNPLA